MSKALPCPVCGAPIPLNFQLLARGVSLVCENTACGASIGIAPSSLPTFASAVEKAERLEALRPAPRR